MIIQCVLEWLVLGFFTIAMLLSIRAGLEKYCRINYPDMLDLLAPLIFVFSIGAPIVLVLLAIIYYLA